MCYTLVYYFFIPVLIKGSLYKATRKQIRKPIGKEEKMKNLKRCNNLSLVLMIVTWGLFCFGNISLDTVLIVSMIWSVGQIIGVILLERK